MLQYILRSNDLIPKSAAYSTSDQSDGKEKLLVEKTYLDVFFVNIKNHRAPVVQYATDLRTKRDQNKTEGDFKNIQNRSTWNRRLR